ncbi:MAG: CDP-alcohol phosphatidyltransferase family protein [Sedimentisphaerales bacterium]|nr:CDP-alcohol phosphatidyltransferase family protein [Sedimentisphaerales bacterium]
MQLTWANKITIVRILLIAPFVICMLKINEPDSGLVYRYIAFGIFIIMCFSDALDGYMARVKKQVTKLGSFLDPLADKLLMTCACILLATTKTAVKGFELPSWVVVLIIGKDLFLMTGFITLFLFTSDLRIIPAVMGKTSTFLQLTMVIAILIAPEVSGYLGWWVYFVRILWILTASAAILSTLIYIRAGKRYIEQFDNNAANGE